METKYVKVPFDVELAKKITNGEVEGKIVTRDGTNARIICFDREDERLPIVGLVKVEAVEVGDVKLEGGEMICPFHLDGMDGRRKFSCHGNPNDLMLEVPEYTTFKDGDVITFDECETILIAKGNPYKDKAGTIYIDCYAVVINGYFYADSTVIINSLRLATEEEKQKLVDALKSNKGPKAKKYLKRFFGIEEEEIIEAEIKEEKSEYKFKPFDKVLVRDFKNIAWSVDFFSHYNNSGYRYNTLHGGTWKYCIPYNEQTAHLLGTSDNYE